MMVKFNFRFMLILCAMALFASSEPVFSGSLPMREIQSQYKEKTGKTWEDATAEEKRVFLNILDPDKDQNSAVYKKKDQLKELKDLSKVKERAPYYIRYNFEKKTGMNWEDATEKEQEKFQKDYETLMKKIQREETARERAISLEEQK